MITLREGWIITTFDIVVSIASVVLGTAAIVYVIYLCRVSGRDRPRDPERLRRFIAKAPYHLFNKEVFTRAVEGIGSESAAEAWMNESCIGLDNVKPIDLVSTSAGAAAVKAYLNQIEHGVYT